MSLMGAGLWHDYGEYSREKNRPTRVSVYETLNYSIY